MSFELELTYQKISQHLNQIAPLFKNPAITIIIRSPDLADADMILTNDDLNFVIKAIENLQNKSENKVV